MQIERVIGSTAGCMGICWGLWGRRLESWRLWIVQASLCWMVMLVWNAKRGSRSAVRSLRRVQEVPIEGADRFP